MHKHTNYGWSQLILNLTTKKCRRSHINIGQNFIGSPFGYYDPNKKSLYLENKNKVINLPQRDGNFPAIQTLILDKGFHILNYETNYEFLKYESVEKFEDFLKEQDLESTVGNFDTNKIPTESYQKICKSINDRWK